MFYFISNSGPLNRTALVWHHEICISTDQVFYKEIAFYSLKDRKYHYALACHILNHFVDDFIRNINFAIGVLHVKRQILTYFCDVMSLFALVFIVSFDRAYKEVSTKNIEICLWLRFCDMTVLIGLYSILLKNCQRSRSQGRYIAF